MANRFYTATGKTVANGDVSDQTDINDVNTAVETACDDIATELDSLNAISIGAAILKDGSVAMTGELTLKDSTPTAALKAASKGYVDSKDELVQHVVDSTATPQTVGGTRSYPTDNTQITTTSHGFDSGLSLTITPTVATNRIVVKGALQLASGGAQVVGSLHNTDIHAVNSIAMGGAGSAVIPVTVPLFWSGLASSLNGTGATTFIAYFGSFAASVAYINQTATADIWQNVLTSYLEAFEYKV